MVRAVLVFDRCTRLEGLFVCEHLGQEVFNLTLFQVGNMEIWQRAPTNDHHTLHHICTQQNLQKIVRRRAHMCCSGSIFSFWSNFCPRNDFLDSKGFDLLLNHHNAALFIRCTYMPSDLQAQCMDFVTVTNFNVGI